MSGIPLIHRLAIASLAIATLLPSASVQAQAVTVVVGGQQLYLNPGPIEQSGRVFVPLRGIFERLGASVVYSAGTINATKGSTTVSLRIGSNQVILNGQTQTLDVAPFIVGATTYVPLRFVAQSLGATVNYDDGTRVVAIGTGQQPPPVAPVRPPPYNPPPPPPPVVNLVAQQPAPNALVTDRFTTIGTQFSHQVRPGTVTVWLDGNDITSRAGVYGRGFSYSPPAPLDFGAHTVRVAGTSANGAGFDFSWKFRTPAAPVSITITQPAANAQVGSAFMLRGSTVANGQVTVTAGIAPATTGQFSGNTTAGPRGNFSISVLLGSASGQQPIRVRIVVTDPATSRKGDTTLPFQFNFSMNARGGNRS